MSDHPKFLKSTVSEHLWLQPAAEALEDAHNHWHDAAAAYHSPSEFRRHVDAAVQTLRNVTFRLQSAKGDGPASFADWYESEEPHSWRAFLRGHPVMAWLHDARTTVTHKGGLKRSSVAVVSVIVGHLAAPAATLKLDPEMTTVELVAKAIKQIPPEYRPHQAVEVLRTWVSDDLPTHELLTALRECLHVLDGLLAFAAESTGAVVEVAPADFVKSVEYPSCMIATPHMTPLTFMADTGESYELGFEAYRLDESLVEVGVERYGIPEPLSKEATLREFAGWIHDRSRTAFKKDGHVVPVAWLRRSDGSWAMYMVPTRDKRDKYLLWRQLGWQTMMHQYDAIVHTGEVWMAPTPADLKPYYDAAAAKGVREYIHTMYDSASGDAGLIVSRISRVVGMGMLSKPSEQNTGEFNFTATIRRSWRLMEEIRRNGIAEDEVLGLVGGRRTPLQT